MDSEEKYLQEFRENIHKEIKIVKEIFSILTNFDHGGGTNKEEKMMMTTHLDSLKGLLRRTVEEVTANLEDISMIKPLAPQIDLGAYEKTFPSLKEQASKKEMITPKNFELKKHHLIDVEITDIDKKTIKRLKRKEIKREIILERKPSKYVSFSNKLFGDYSDSLSKKSIFVTIKRDLIKAHLQYTPQSYISIILFSTLLSFVISLLLLIFLLFFKIELGWPIITTTAESFGSRFLKFFWVPLAIPIVTIISIYTYPSLEKRYIGNRIDQELPFATIHMSAIAGSLVEPSKMFSIIISTREYPFLEKELTKLINEINIYGYDLVTALRNTGFNSPSTRLAELLNGIAITINSGGNLQDFFDKRAQTLLFEYRLEREKYTKTAETFMDIYISLVIAAPMILMLLLIIMRVSGLGISISTSMITLIMILGVAMVNIIFLTFLQLKQPSG